MIRTDVNPWDFLKSILHVGDFTRQFKCGDLRPILGNWNLWPWMWCEFFLHRSYCKERKSFVTPVIVDILIGIVGIDYIYYSLLYFTFPSVFCFTDLIFGSSYWKLFFKCYPLKVAVYKPALFLKLNSSRVNFHNF